MKRQTGMLKECANCSQVATVQSGLCDKRDQHP